MNKLAKKLAIGLMLVSLVYYLPVFATEVSEADFDRNYLISDEEIQNYTSMTRADIQAFLDDYGGYISTYHADDIDGIRRLASDIIYRAALEYKINPKYLLVKLQKEMSLITDKNPTSNQLDFATGYDCPDSGGCGEKNRGFGKQVDAAAGIIRWYYDHYSTEDWIKQPNRTYIIDGQVVIPKNYATAFLYTYTPHLHGNLNFWKLWHTWFGQVYPDGSLIKGYNSPTVYLIQEGKKRAISSMSVLISRYNPKMIISIPVAELNNYENGKELTFANYSILKQNTNYYLVDFDTIRPFANYNVVKALGYNPGEFIEVTPTDISNYTLGKIITAEVKNFTGRLVRGKETKGLYYLKDNYYYFISDEQMAKINFPNLSEETVSITDLQNYTDGGLLKFKDGTLLGIKGSNKIYVIENDKKRHIASEEVFNGFGFNWDNIIWTDQLTGISHLTGQALYLPTRLIDKEENNNIASTTEEVEKNSKMQTTPTEEIAYLGKTFTTNLETYLIADYETEEILAGKNVDVIRPMASFVKVMTGYRLLKEGLNLNYTSTYQSNLHKAVYHHFRTVDGEKFINRDLMWSLLISSLNTPARILVNEVEIDERQFIARMNKQLNEWGLTKTKFTDTYGYDLGNVTTAREFMTLFKQTTRNMMLKNILAKKSYEYDELKDLDGKPHHYDNHSNALVNATGLKFNIITSKTGYLNEARACLVMTIERQTDGKKFIVITMGNPDYDNRFLEPKKIANWAINNF